MLRLAEQIIRVSLSDRPGKQPTGAGRWSVCTDLIEVFDVLQHGGEITDPGAGVSGTPSHPPVRHVRVSVGGEV